MQDGASNTFLAGEKYLNPDWYATGLDIGDNETMYLGHNEDIDRWGGPRYPPHQDQAGYGGRMSFGSAHAGSYNAVFCDGSVHAINYTIELETHRRLVHRRDSLPVDASKI